MLFSSVTFLYWFIPVVFALYFIVPSPGGSAVFKNAVLLIASMVFYAWGEPVFLLLMTGEIIVNYVLGLLIDRFRGSAWSKVFMIASVAAGIGALGLFKYTNFFIEVINHVSGNSFSLLLLSLPLGISFYTFQILSYTIDLYRGKAELQRNPFYFAMYVVLFPQLVAGPIVRYTDVAAEIGRRTHSLTQVADGITRFVLGLGKKILLGNLFGELAVTITGAGGFSVLGAWLYALAYTLHIYFDFSGYSDMAIGLGKVFGFNFPENFNYPYIAKSVTDFWRRWHMTLSGWFRDYVYIPLGGNRVAPARHIFNILLVWLLTGFWHGAGLNFILWGGYFGVILLIEKYFLGKYLGKLPAFAAHIYLLLIVIISWVIFDGGTLANIGYVLGSMFGKADGLADAASLYYLRSYAVPLILGVIGCTPFAKHIARQTRNVTLRLKPLFILILMILITAYLVDGSFNPFIYFRF